MITPNTYLAMEAFSRIAEIDASYVQSVGEEKIQRAYTLINSGSEWDLSSYLAF